MNTRNVLIVSDADNQIYWKTLLSDIRRKAGPVNLLLDKNVLMHGIIQPYDVILVDVSNLEDLYRLIPEIREEQPESRIIILASTPTWKQTREVIRMGAASIIRKSYDLDELIEELQPL